jgi:predicted nucleotidyltransferase
MSATNTLPDNATLLTRVVVGSRLHGLNKANSDYDYRGVFLHPLQDVLSPWKQLKNTHWIEGDNDNTAFELADFVKRCTKGDPNSLEVLWSDIIEHDTLAFSLLRKARVKLLDSKAIYEAHKNYSHSQYKKMNLFEPDARTPKFAVAYIRSLVQGIQLLERGTFEPSIERYNPKLAKELMAIKYDYSNYSLMTLTSIFEAYMQKLNEAYAANHKRFTPDIAWLEDYLVEIQANNFGIGKEDNNGTR